ncbi:hypothetical protein C8Q76DRAFT_716718 [Earliella scabrosa]|nr:hypothetical protein C8Q76DRAFT_716718 [Earliella scabrosa]
MAHHPAVTAPSCAGMRSCQLERARIKRLVLPPSLPHARDRARHCRCTSPSTLLIHCEVDSGRRRGTPALFVDRLEDRLDVGSTWGSDLVFLPR